MPELADCELPRSSPVGLQSSLRVQSVEGMCCPPSSPLTT